MKRDKTGWKDYVAEDIMLDRIYRPGSMAELVFNIESLKPDVRTVLLYEFDSDTQRVIFSQPQPEILPRQAKEPLHLTKQVEAELNRSFRIGVVCTIHSFIEAYRLSSGKTDRAVQVTIQPESIQIVNIRSAYRFTPNSAFRVDARIHFSDGDFFSGKDFSVYNISSSGIGLAVRKNRAGEIRSWMAMKVGDMAEIELTLHGEMLADTGAIIRSYLQVVRIEQKDLRKTMYVGARFNKLSVQDEEVLSRFIHQAQLHEIRSIKG